MRVDRVLDLSWLRDEAADRYCLDDSRPGIDPEVAVRFMLAGLLSQIVHDRRLMREAEVNLAIRWFAGYALHEKLPDHSSLTRIRQRWGPKRFKAVLSRTVKACLAAKVATGEVVHLDATLIRANVSWDAIVEAHADAIFTALDSTSAPSPEVATTSKTQRICRTDPDASLGKGGRLPRVEPAYKQQTAVDAKQGVILDVEVTTGGVHDSNTLSALDEVPRVTGRSITIATMDAGYGVARVFAELEARRIEASFQHGASHPRKKGLFPRVGSNWMGGTIVSAVSEAGIRCRTANQMRRASKFIVQAFATAVHVHRERFVSAQTLSAGRFFFIMIIPRYCGLGVGISLGLSVNESSMPPIAHVSRAFTEKRKLGMDWLGRYGAVSPT